MIPGLILEKPQRFPWCARAVAPEPSEIFKTGDGAPVCAVEGRAIVTPLGGFPHYGEVRSPCIVLHGSLPGPAKRLLRLRLPMRSQVTSVEKVDRWRLARWRSEILCARECLSAGPGILMATFDLRRGSILGLLASCRSQVVASRVRPV